MSNNHHPPPEEDLVTLSGIFQFLQGNEAHLRARARADIQSLFPAPESASSASTTTVPAQATVNFGHDAAGTGLLTHQRADERIMDPLAMALSLSLSREGGGSLTPSHPPSSSSAAETPRETTMQNLRNNHRAYDHDQTGHGANLRPCIRDRECAFLWLCNVVSHPLAQEGKRVGISFLFEDEWDLPQHAVPQRPCVICLQYIVNYMASSTPWGGTEIRQGETMGVINPFYVAVERPGEFCRDACIFSPRIRGPFPRFETSMYTPAAIMATDQSGRPEEFRDCGAPSSSPDTNKSGFAGLIPWWRGFHSRGRRPEIRALRQDRFIMESPLAPAGERTTHGRLPRISATSAAASTDPDHQFIVGLMRLSFTELVARVRSTGYPAMAPQAVYAAVILYPQISPVPFTPPSQRTYLEYFLGGNLKDISMGDGVMSLYPHHGLPSGSDCKAASIYWACLLRANLLALLAYREPVAGAWRRDHLISLVEATAPLMKFLRDEYRRIGRGRPPLDSELDLSRWSTIVPENVRPPGAADVFLPPDEDLVHIKSPGIAVTTLSGQGGFGGFSQGHCGGLRSYYRQASAIFPLRELLVDEEEWVGQPEYTVLRRILEYFHTSAEGEGPRAGRVAARRMSCVPLMVHLSSAVKTHCDTDLLASKVILRTQVVLPLHGVFEAPRGGLPLLSIFPLSFNRGLWAEDALPNYSHVIMAVLMGESGGRGLAAQEDFGNEDLSVAEGLAELYTALLMLDHMESRVPTAASLSASAGDCCYYHTPRSTEAAGMVSGVLARRLVGGSGRDLLAFLRKIVGCLCCGTFGPLVGHSASGNLQWVVRAYSALSHEGRFGLFMESGAGTHLLMVALLLYLRACAFVRPSLMAPLAELFENAHEIMVSGATGVATGMLDTVAEGGTATLSSLDLCCLKGLQRQPMEGWLKRRPRVITMVHHLNSQLAQACIVAEDPLPHADVLRRSHEKALGIVGEYISAVVASGGRSMERALLALVGITELRFGGSAAGALLAYLRSPAVVGMSVWHPPQSPHTTALLRVQTGPEATELASVLRGGGGLVVFRMFVEQLYCWLNQPCLVFRHGDPDTSCLALAQRGRYAHRGLQGVVSDVLSVRDLSTRIPLLAITEVNAEIHNYRRMIGGLRQVNNDGETGGISVLNIRRNGKPTLRKLLNFLYRFTPRLVSLPGNVVVFSRTMYGFRRNQKALYQATLISKMLRNERAQVISSLLGGRPSKLPPPLIGGVAADSPAEAPQAADAGRDSKVWTLVMCTECGTPVPYSPSLFGPWDGLWCGACPSPMGQAHRATYCVSCNARIVDFSPSSKKGVFTDTIIGRHRIRRRGGPGGKGRAFKDWYNMSSRSYTVLDDVTHQRYTINLCDPCTYTCDFDRVESVNGPFVLGTLMNALKNPRSVIAHSSSLKH
jgi:hypothetical protein